MLPNLSGSCTLAGISLLLAEFAVLLQASEAATEPSASPCLSVGGTEDWLPCLSVSFTLSGTSQLSSVFESSFASEAAGPCLLSGVSSDLLHASGLSVAVLRLLSLGHSGEQSEASLEQLEPLPRCVRDARPEVPTELPLRRNGGWTGTCAANEEPRFFLGPPSSSSVGNSEVEPSFMSTAFLCFTGVSTSKARANPSRPATSEPHSVIASPSTSAHMGTTVESGPRLFLRLASNLKVPW
mmetsp:Transcript_120265/g.383976  ORF Transcript_120265/g.383976 Transcript_120265/m.383976 type:complete len:240 (-) Transcript_120265:314-1033(-)